MINLRATRPRDLAALSDVEKEDAALGPVFHPFTGPFNIGWSGISGLARAVGLYLPYDGGIADACETLIQRWRDFEMKSDEADALLAQEELVAKANAAHTSQNWVDKLEMKYGLDLVADARERQDALLAHLNEHADYYRYVLFQALPPTSQQELLLAAAPDLSVGYYEPHAVAMNGDQLAVPLTPVGQTTLAKLVDNLKKELETATNQAAEASEGIKDDDWVLPTPGFDIVVTRGACGACGDHELEMRRAQRLRAFAEADMAIAEAERRRRLLAKGNLTDPDVAPRAPVEVVLRSEAASSSRGPTGPVQPPRVPRGEAPS